MEGSAPPIFSEYAVPKAMTKKKCFLGIVSQKGSETHSLGWILWDEQKQLESHK